MCAIDRSRPTNVTLSSLAGTPRRDRADVGPHRDNRASVALAVGAGLRGRSADTRRGRWGARTIDAANYRCLKKRYTQPVAVSTNQRSCLVACCTKAQPRCRRKPPYRDDLLPGSHHTALSSSIPHFTLYAKVVAHDGAARRPCMTSAVYTNACISYRQTDQRSYTMPTRTGARRRHRRRQPRPDADAATRHHRRGRNARRPRRSPRPRAIIAHTASSRGALSLPLWARQARHPARAGGPAAAPAGRSSALAPAR